MKISLARRVCVGACLCCCAIQTAQGLVRPLARSGSHYRRQALSLAASSSTNSRSLSHEEISRYSRHLVLADVGIQGQVAFKEAAVLVIGAGGLGSPCLLYLAAAGVGHVGIVDADVVDASNLQRQVIHDTTTIGVSKCESAARRMQAMNPFVKVRLYKEEFTSETAMRILRGGFDESKKYDIVVDGSDNFPTKYLIK
jgi:sulfur-carrier protein adenylyltransferase/sulfurtransferase